MTDELKSRIKFYYDLHDSDEVSTETLLQMVADDCCCSISDVVDALQKEQE